MSDDQKKKRNMSEIQNEYQNLCLKAGHIQYNVKVLQKDLDMVNSQLLDLNLEAAAAKAAEEKAKSEVEPATNQSQAV